MIKIDIISGFLGAGKTTLIAKLLKEKLSGEKVILIENEFGEIGIDGGFLKSAGVQIREMNQGCICCSLVGDFGAALKEVIETYSPERIIIEPSGVGKLSDVIKAVLNASEGMDEELKINCAVTVVDVMKCKVQLRNFGEFYEDQISSAGTVILTRTDLEKASQEKIDEACALIRGLNPKVTIVTTAISELSADRLLSVMEKGGEDLAEQMLKELSCGREHHHHHEDECGCGHEHHHHHAEEVFTSWGCETTKKYSLTEIEAIAAKLAQSPDYGEVLRAKGIVALADGGWEYFDMVPGEYEIRAGEPEFTGRICVIGSELKKDKLEELFGV